jgi:hypothetical protein
MRARGDTIDEITKACPALSKHRTTITYILENPIYIGTGIYNGVEIPDYCEPLIDTATFHAARQVSEKRGEGHRTAHPRTVRSPYLLSGLLECRICGNIMFGQTYIKRGTHNMHQYYRCNSRYDKRCGAKMIPKDELETMVIDRLVDAVLHPDILRDLIAEVQRSREGHDQRHAERIASSRSELDALSTRIARVVSAIAEYGHSRALLTELAELEEQQRQAAIRLTEIESQPVSTDYPDPITLSRESIALLHQENPRIQKEILSSFIVSITAERLEDGRIEGSMRYRLPAGELVGVIDL